MFIITVTCYFCFSIILFTSGSQIRDKGVVYGVFLESMVGFLQILITYIAITILKVSDAFIRIFFFLS